MPSKSRTAGGKGGDYASLADEELISLVGAGDAVAFDALYARHFRAAYSLSYRMAGGKQAAECLVQDAFLKVWRSAGAYSARRGSVRTWILTVVHNPGIDRFPKRPRGGGARTGISAKGGSGNNRGGALRRPPSSVAYESPDAWWRYPQQSLRSQITRPGFVSGRRTALPGAIGLSRLAERSATRRIKCIHVAYGRVTQPCDNERTMIATTTAGNRAVKDPVISLIEAYRERGDRRAIERVLALNTKILHHLARRYAGSSDESFEDILQVGYVGLMKAVNNFRLDSEARFSSYAYAMIEGEIRHHLRDTERVKKPRWARALYSQVRKANVRLSAELGRPPLVEETAREVNVTPEGIVELMKIFRDSTVVSLDGSEGEETADLSTIRSVQHESFSLPIEDRIQLEQALESLSEIQRKVVYLFFYKDLCQTEIGKKLGLSQRKTSRTIASALKALKSSNVLKASDNASGWGLE